VRTSLLVILIAFMAAEAMGMPQIPRDAGDATPISIRSIYQLQATWSDDEDRPTKLAALLGQSVVIAMFYTSCENACPIIVSEMKRIQEALPAALREKTRLVLVTFDSDHDSSAILHHYREGMRLGDGWELLHGSPDDVRGLAMVLGVKYEEDGRGQFAHSNLITVLNPAGEIVYQRVGLTGEVSSAVNAVVASAK
jgi:protein SCO1